MYVCMYVYMYVCIGHQGEREERGAGASVEDGRDAVVAGERAQGARVDTNWGMLPAESVTVLSEAEAEEYRARDKAKLKRQVQ